VEDAEGFKMNGKEASEGDIMGRPFLPRLSSGLSKKEGLPAELGVTWGPCPLPREGTHRALLLESFQCQGRGASHSSYGNDSQMRHHPGSVLD
jgi:hypothetical protein